MSSQPSQPAIHVQQMPSSQQPSQSHPKPPSVSKYSLSPLNFSPGTRSPSSVGESMPSSPTSIHSSSSAIFERDIEIPLNANSPLQLIHTDPHHTSRAKVHEPLENNVPSVLTAAVATLSEIDPSGSGSSSVVGSPTSREGRRGVSMDEISIIAPAPLSPHTYTTSSAASKHQKSRSPSPHILPLPGLPPTTPVRVPRTPHRIASTALPNDPSLTSISASLSNADSQATPQPISPDAGRGTHPSVIGIVPPTPNANSFAFNASPRTAYSGGSPSPPSATASPLIVTPPLPGVPGAIPRSNTTASTSRSPSRPTSVALSLEELSLAPLLTTTADSPIPVPPDVEPIALSGNVHPRPPSPNASASLASATANKRLSFISYNDLLNSTPVSSFPLSSVTTSAEPPHQVDVQLRTTHRTRTSSRQSTFNRSPISDVFAPSPLEEAMSEILAKTHSHDTGLKAGGEWQREGFGTGLEERLEAALKEQDARSQKDTSSVIGA
ncbi:hypothetical protein FRB99_008598 [Tulasnella sp. 403]|nr:hypothetical protein FRB99_008598 [Tulasnella sp. 403]